MADNLSLSELEKVEQLPVVEIGKVFDVTALKDGVYGADIKGQTYQYPQVADFLSVNDTQTFVPNNNVGLLQTILNAAGNAEMANALYGEPSTEFKGIFTDLLKESK